jgi:pantetheine-phosphate adenylyltransferase
VRRLGIYPGSFDPITLGHVNIVHRALALFDEVMVAILVHPDKKAWFTAEERAALIEQTFAAEPRVRVDRFGGLLVDYVRRCCGTAVIRGLRGVQDFDYEFQMTMMNRRLAPDIDTVFMMTDEAYFYVASRTVREVASLGGSISGLVPAPVERAIAARLARP